MSQEHMLGFARYVKVSALGVALIVLSACSATPTGSPAEATANSAPAVQTEASPGAAEQPQAGAEVVLLGDVALWQWQAGAERWRYNGEINVPEVPPASWVFEEDAIRLTVTASNQLNAFDGVPHTLVLRLFQLNGRSDFRDERKTRSGIRQLLVADSLDALGASVVAYNEMVIRPGGTVARVFARSAETRFLAVVAGYYDLNREQVTRLVSFPAIDDSVIVERGLLDQLTLGLFEEQAAAVPRRPGRLSITLNLDSDKIGFLAVEAQ